MHSDFDNKSMTELLDKYEQDIEISNKPMRCESSRDLSFPKYKIDQRKDR